MGEKINKNCGIYKITSPSGKIYIGQSKNIKKRFTDYRLMLRCNKQKRLYYSLKKYSPVNHQFDIIEYCTEDELNCSERFWQDEFDVIGKMGLNCVLQECGEKRRQWTEDVIKSIKERNTKSIKVINIITGEIFQSIKEASNHIGINPVKLARQLRGTTPNMSDFVKYEDYLLNNTSIRQDGVRIKKVINVKTKVIFSSVKEASKEISESDAYLATKLKGLVSNNTDFVYYSDYINNISREKEYYKKGNCCQLIDVATLEVFSSIKEVSKIKNINYHTLIGWLQKPHLNKTDLVYLKDYESKRD